MKQQFCIFEGLYNEPEHKNANMRTPLLKKGLAFLLLFSPFLLLAQTYDLPCDAETNPINGWGNTTETQTLSGDFTGVSPWETDLAPGDLQDFGVVGADSSVFYKLEVYEYTSYITVEFDGGPVSDLSAALFSVANPCPGATNYGEALYQDADGNDLLVEDLVSEGFYRFDLCGFSSTDYDNLYLWLAVPDAGVGSFTIDVTQEVSPYNNLCEDVSDPGRSAGDLGLLSYNDQVGEGLGCTEPAGWTGPQTNEAACPIDFDFNVTPCFDGHEDDPSVWYTFETGQDVELIDLTVEHFVSADLRVSVFEMENPCMAGNALFPGTQDPDDYCDFGAGSIVFENLIVKPNTQYFILVSTPIDEWGEFDICLEVCEPPANNIICDAEEIDFPDLGSYDPDLAIPGSPIAGTTLCANGFFDDLDLNSLIEFGCGDEFESAVFYKLNIDDYATKLNITVDGLTGGGQLAAQVFLFDGTLDCINRGYNADISIFTEPGFNECDFAPGNDMEMDLCGVPNTDYDNLYLWVASSTEDQGDFNLEFFQEIAPINDLCEDASSPDREATDLGLIDIGDNSGDCNEPAGWTTQTNRGACPVGFPGVSACFDGFEDQAVVWYRFETGDDVELVTVDVNHFEADEVRMALFEMPDVCNTFSVPPGQDEDEYCTGEMFNGGVDSLWNVLVRANTEYFIVVSTDEDQWGEFEICVRNCEPPENDNVCDIIGDPNYDVRPGVEDETNRNEIVIEGTTVCANNFFTGFDLQYEDFDCGDSESAVFYKIDLEENATEFTITTNFIDPVNTLSTGIFLLDDPCDPTRQYNQEPWLDPDMQPLVECDANVENEITFNLCGLDADDLDNVYIWVATERKDQGEFEIEISQKLAPENDECEDAFQFNPAEIDREECYQGNNFWGCPENLTGAISDCIEPLTLPGYATVWHEITVGMEIDFLEVDLNHSFGGEVIVTAIEFAGAPCESDFIELACGDAADGMILDSVPPPTNPAGQVFILVSSPADESSEYELCVTGREIIGCLNDPPPQECLCATEPICGADTLSDYCLQMESFQTPWSGFPGCPGNVLNNPNWFSFIAGEDPISLLISPDNCVAMGGANGIQIGIYTSDEPDFPPDPDCTNCNPSMQSLNPVFTQCGCVTTPVTASWTPEPGRRYFVVIDGCAGAFCEVEVEVLEGGDPPLIGDFDIGDFEEVQLEEFDDVDTFCLGSTGVTLDIVTPTGAGILEYQILPGGSVESVVADGSGGTVTIDIPNSFFTSEGSFEICAIAFNECGSSSDEICKEYYVQEIPDRFDDPITVCKNETEMWEGMEVPGSGHAPGTTVTYDAPLTSDPYGCPYTAFIDVTRLDDNEDNPTEVDTFVCYDELITVGFNYFCETIEEPGTFEQACEGLSENGCDTFFVIDLLVMGGPYLIDPLCDGNGNMIFSFQDAELAGYTPWAEQFQEYANNPDFTIEYEWVIVGSNMVLGTDQNLTLSQLEIEQNENNGELTLRLDITIRYQGDVVCVQESPPYTFILSENFPSIINILGDTTFCLDQEELVLYSNYEDPSFPIPNGDPDDVFLRNWTIPNGFDFVPPSNPASDTITIQAPPANAGSTLCLEVTTQRCFFSDELCIDLIQEDPDEPNLGPDDATCERSYTFDPISASSGGWSIIDTPPGGNTATIAPLGSTNATVEVTEPGLYTFEWREGPISCARYDTIQIEFYESPFMANYADTCFDLDFVVEIEMNGGAGGYTVNGNSDISGTFTGDTFTSDTIAIDFDTNFGDILYLVVEDANGCLSDSIPVTLVCQCDTEAGDMALDTLVLCEDEDAMPNYLGGHVNDGNDTLVYVLHTSDTTELGTVLDSSLFSDGTFSYFTGLDFGRVYYISTVIGTASGGGWTDLTDPCLAVPEGQPVIWYENPVAEAGIDTVVCGLSYSLEAIPSVGEGSWSAVPDTGAVSFSDINDPNSEVTVDEAGTYTFEWSENNEGCQNSDEVNVIFEGDINFRVVYECDGTATNYVATIILNGGGGNYFETMGQGTFISPDSLQTPSIPKGDLVVYVINNDLGCGPDTVNITTECECTTEIGTMDTDTLLTACSDECIDVTSLYDDMGEFQDGNDLGGYILHNRSDTVVGRTSYAQRANGIFCYQDLSGTIPFGDTLYISRIVGNDGGAGRVDTTDECLKVSFGVPVVYYERPIADAGTDRDVCDLNGQLTAVRSISNAQGSWGYLNGPSPNVNISVVNSDTTEVTVEDFGTHVFVWTETNNGCLDRDTVELTFLSTPSVETGSIEIECDDIGETYTVTFDIVLGEESTLMVSGDSGSLNGRTFTSDPINSGDTYNFSVSDANDCGTSSISDVFECPCLTEIGSIEGVELNLCEDETVTGVSYDPGGEFRDGNDELVFVLIDDMDNILFESSTADFGFDAGSMNLGETYFVRVYLGSVVSGDFQFGEDCTLFDGDIPVTWWAYPEAIAVPSADEITCVLTSIDIDGSGSVGDRLSFSWTTSDGSIEAGTGDQEVVTVNSGGNYLLVVTDELSGCSDEITVLIEQSDDVPEARIQEPEILTCEVLEVELDGSQSSSGPNIEYVWTTTDGNIISDTSEAIVTVDAVGTYRLLVRNTSNDCEVTASVEVFEERELPEVFVQSGGVLSCSAETIEVSSDGSSSGADFDYQWGTLNGSILTDIDAPSITVDSSGTYQLIITNNGNGCVDSASVDVMRAPEELTEIEVNPRDPLCNGDQNGQIEIIAVDGAEPVTYTLEGVDENNSGTFTGLGPGIYNITVTDANGCVVTDQVELVDPPIIEITLSESIIIEEGDSVIVDAFLPPSAIVDTIMWDTEGTPFRCLDPECLSILLSPLNTITVSATAVGGVGCSDEDATRIIVRVNRDIFIPNVFSPNNDGVNDAFLPEAGRRVEIVNSMQIFDRWGNMMFESQDFMPGETSAGWDGTYRGKELDPGVFVYRVEATFDDGNTRIISGTVTLVR